MLMQGSTCPEGCRCWGAQTVNLMSTCDQLQHPVPSGWLLFQNPSMLGRLASPGAVARSRACTVLPCCALPGACRGVQRGPAGGDRVQKQVRGGWVEHSVQTRGQGNVLLFCALARDVFQSGACSGQARRPQYHPTDNNLHDAS